MPRSSSERLASFSATPSAPSYRRSVSGRSKSPSVSVTERVSTSPSLMSVAPSTESISAEMSRLAPLAGSCAERSERLSFPNRSLYESAIFFPSKSACIEPRASWIFSNLPPCMARRSFASSEFSPIVAERSNCVSPFMTLSASSFMYFAMRMTSVVT